MNNSTDYFFIDINDEEVVINERKFVFPVKLNILIQIFKKPSLIEWDSDNCHIVWDKIGIATRYNRKHHHSKLIFGVDVLISNNHNLFISPKNTFRGKIRVNGSEINPVDTKTLELKKSILDPMYFNDNCYGISIYKNIRHKEEAIEIEIDTTKYLQKGKNTNSKQFKDFNFKLAVIQVLMYEKDLLEPKFDLYEFVDLYTKREIDIEEEGYKIIREVKTYFNNLEIPSKLLDEVDEICQDGGNEIYTQLMPFWEGEDETFNITSTADLELVPNLKKITLLFDAGRKMVNEFKTRGINAEYL